MNLEERPKKVSEIVVEKNDQKKVELPDGEIGDKTTVFNNSKIPIRVALVFGDRIILPQCEAFFEINEDGFWREKTQE